jgi:hypothetical protein
MRLMRRAALFLSLSSPFLLLAPGCVGDAPTVLPQDAGSDAPIQPPDGSAPDGSAPDADAGPPPKPEWTLALTGRTSIAALVVEPTSGDVFVAGSAKSAVPELGITGTNNDSEDWLVARLEGASGKVLWAKVFGGPADDRVSAIAFSAGSVYVLGITYGTELKFPNANPGATLTLPSIMGVAAPLATMSALAKLNAQSGDPAWALSPDAGESAATAHRSLCTRLAWGQQLQVSCQYAGSKFGVNPTYAPSHAYSASMPFGQAAILRFNALGGFMGIPRAFSSSTATSSAVVSGLAVRGNDVFVAGSAGTTLTETMNAATVFTGGTALNGFILRFTEGTTSGITSYQRFGGAGSNVQVGELAVDGAGATLTGQFGGTVGFGPTMLTASGTKDGFITRLPSDLSAVAFAKRFGGSNEEHPFALAVTTAGGPAIWTGGRYFSADFGFGTSTLPAPAANTYQGFFGKANAMGDPSSAIALTSAAGNVMVNALGGDDARTHVFAAGTYDGVISFDDGTKATSKADAAGFVVRRKL